MFDRLLPNALFRGQLKTLSDYRSKKPSPAKIERATVYGLPVFVFALMAFTCSSIAKPDAILAGITLFAGALLTAFAQLSAWRDRLAERAAKFQASESTDRDALDETATHLLAASYVSAITAALLILGMNFSSGETGEISGFWAWSAAASGTYVLLVFLIALPRLYKNYMNINKVRHELNGTSQ